MQKDWSVYQISHRDVEPWLLKRHYARRIPPISYAFGAFDGKELIGIVTYGVPLSSTLRTGVCGEEYEPLVLELNRLCCKNKRNIASRLVSNSMELIPKPKIIVSYADSAQGHVGYVYQATNFIYTGLTSKMMDWKVKGMDALHHCSIGDEFRGQENRSQKMKDKYGDLLYQEERSRKHRYVFFTGSKKEKKKMKACLKYEIHPYPKGDVKRYDASAAIDTQMLLIS
jgi:hypothetical protein